MYTEVMLSAGRLQDNCKFHTICLLSDTQGDYNSQIVLLHLHVMQYVYWPAKVHTRPPDHTVPESGKILLLQTKLHLQVAPVGQLAASIGAYSSLLCAAEFDNHFTASADVMCTGCCLVLLSILCHADMSQHGVCAVFVIYLPSHFHVCSCAAVGCHILMHCIGTRAGSFMTQPGGQSSGCVLCSQVLF